MLNVLITIQVRRLMEDENKKERKGVKRSHNDAVRELVAFVRKRDKRLAAHQAEEAKRRMEREEEDKLRFVASVAFGVMLAGLINA